MTRQTVHEIARALATLAAVVVGNRIGERTREDA